MSPLDIEQLPWGVFRENPAVDAAYNHLLARADRPVLLHDRRLVPGVPNAFRTAWVGGIHIFCDVTGARRDHTLVHELLHEILTAEGYCILSGIPRELGMVHEALSNEMSHPEIFRRMEAVYGLDMAIYWGHWRGEIRREMDTLKEQSRESDWWLAHFPRLYTWFFQEVSQPFLPEYAAACPRVYQAVEAAAKEVERIGFATAKDYRSSMEVFREHWLRFCERHVPRSPYGPPAHAVIKATTIRPIIERDKSVTPEQLLNLLVKRGFQPA